MKKYKYAELVYYDEYYYLDGIEVRDDDGDLCIYEMEVLNVLGSRGWQVVSTNKDLKNNNEFIMMKEYVDL